jgi:hypothetical protein
MNQPSLDKQFSKHRGQIPWTYSGQVIDMEGTVEKCDVYSLQGFLKLKAHLVKLRV